jgi:hypothetical protein
VCATVGDLLAFGDFLLGDPSLLATLRTPVAWSGFGARYGLGLNVAEPVLFHEGDTNGYKARLLLVPQRRLVAAVAANDAGAGPAIDDVLGPLLRRAAGTSLPWRRSGRYPVIAWSTARLAVARTVR